MRSSEFLELRYLLGLELERSHPNMLFLGLRRRAVFVGVRGTV